jgi:glycosyltransferase involved in cell wall biosynthesis
VVSQTFSDFELILADDCSTDGSPAICDYYAKEDTRIKVIHNIQNKGCPQSRKVGLDAASGDYVLFADSDDWIESDMLELLYNKAVSDNLDMVYCGIYRNTDTEQKKYDSPFLDEKIEMVKQIAACDKFTPSLCNKLIKREIYSKVIFPAANFGEDRQISIQIIHYASKIGYLQTPLYHYYNNDYSLCNANSKALQRYMDEYKIASWTIQFLKNNYNTCFSVFEPKLSAYINSLKFHFVQEKRLRDTHKLHELYPVSNKNIFNVAWCEPLYNKIILFLAVNKLAPLAYLPVDALNVVKKIYRLAIPKNIRFIIWKRRQKAEDS